jgi:outer membrane protein, heavy metal efflux system
MRHGGRTFAGFGFRCALMALSAAWMPGCASAPPPATPTPVPRPVARQPAAPPLVAAAPSSPPAAPIARASFDDQDTQPANRDQAPDAPAELELPVLIDQVLARNPSLQAMIAAWRAASQRYPQAVALDDPVLMTMTAPASWRSSDVTPAYVLGGSQKLPWMGKRPLRGEMARAEANAASMDVADARLELAQAARLAFFEYFLVARQLELNAANVRSLRDYHDTARRQYEANLAVQQDVLQAEVELADLSRRQMELQRAYRVAVARINTLLHQAPDAPLLPPPSTLATGIVPAPPELLRHVALQRRPDLAALGARLDAERAALKLAYKDFWPDLEVYGKYDSFWQPDTQRDLRSQVGVNMNVPIYLEKRRAAAREAMFKLQQKQAEFQQRVDDINREVQTAYERVAEMRDIVRLYSERTLPAADQNVASARAEYVAGRGDFLRLVSAQRQSIQLREKHQEAIAEYHSRLADLERAVAGPIPLEPSETIAPGERRQ